MANKFLGETGMDVLIDEIKKRTAGGDGNDGATDHLIPWEYLIKNDASQAFDFYRIVCEIFGAVQHLTIDDFCGPNKLDILNSDNPAGAPISGDESPISWKEGFAPRTLEDLIIYLRHQQKDSKERIASLEDSQRIGIYQYCGKLCRYNIGEGRSSAILNTKCAYPIDGFADDELITDCAYFDDPLDISSSDSYSTEQIESIFNSLKAGSMVSVHIIRNNENDDISDSDLRQYSNRVLLYMIGSQIYGVCPTYSYKSYFSDGYVNIYMYNGTPQLVEKAINYTSQYEFSYVKSFNKDKLFKSTACYDGDLLHVLNVFSGKYDKNSALR